ncbi:hypothetical protein PR048_019040 [Dryococelus australis]|uniref:Uncharacterized protein n=1 Tax=Dryococelus australis TaxID=614101 RepID=A0ABQ9H2D0_9NEOP|nr:hypothetical protein PR048_019040 [Dryococelus australis]
MFKELVCPNVHVDENHLTHETTVSIKMAMQSLIIPSPGPIDINGPNAVANWTMFFQKFELYLTATQHNESPGSSSNSDIVKFRGRGCSTNDVVNEFQCYYSSKKNTTYERFKFSQRMWEASDKFDQFLTSFKILVWHYEF